MLTVYRDVYLKDTNLSGQPLLVAVDARYQKRKRKRFTKVPIALALPTTDSDIGTPMRNLRRYITKAETIVLNVANGEFPGRY
jgi:hypothetical protein